MTSGQNGSTRTHGFWCIRCVSVMCVFAVILYDGVMCDGFWKVR